MIRYHLKNLISSHNRQRPVDISIENYSLSFIPSSKRSSFSYWAYLSASYYMTITFSYEKPLKRVLARLAIFFEYNRQDKALPIYAIDIYLDSSLFRFKFYPFSFLEKKIVIDSVKKLLFNYKEDSCLFGYLEIATEQKTFDFYNSVLKNYRDNLFSEFYFSCDKLKERPFLEHKFFAKKLNSVQTFSHTFYSYNYTNHLDQPFCLLSDKGESYRSRFLDIFNFFNIRLTISENNLHTLCNFSYRLSMFYDRPATKTFAAIITINYIDKYFTIKGSHNFNITYNFESDEDLFRGLTITLLNSYNTYVPFMSLKLGPDISLNSATFEFIETLAEINSL